jgi:hypothetical protein
VSRFYGVSKSSVFRHWQNHTQPGFVPPPPIGPVSFVASKEWEREKALIEVGARTRLLSTR